MPPRDGTPRPVYHGIVDHPRYLLPWLLLLATAPSCGAHTSIDGDPDGLGVTYGAVGFVTALERFAVYKQDRVADRCTVVSFVYPVERLTPGVELPDRWAVETAWRGSGSRCDDIEVGAPAEASEATDLSGRGVWDETLCEIDVDLTLEFAHEPEEVLRADGIELGWGGCD